MDNEESRNATRVTGWRASPSLGAGLRIRKDVRAFVRTDRQGKDKMPVAGVFQTADPSNDVSANQVAVHDQDLQIAGMLPDKADDALIAYLILRIMNEQADAETAQAAFEAELNNVGATDPRNTKPGCLYIPATVQAFHGTMAIGKATIETTIYASDQAAAEWVGALCVSLAALEAAKGKFGPVKPGG